MENWVPKIPAMSVVSALVFSVTIITTGALPNRAAADDVEHCSLELDDAQRATCFQSNPQQQYEHRIPGWPILNFRSYGSGNPAASATRFAEEHVMCDGTEGTTSLGLHCVDDEMRVVFSMGCTFGNPNTPTKLELLVGAQSSEWKAKVLSNRLGLSIDDSRLANEFVQSIQGNDKIVLGFNPSEAPQFVATFKLNGFDKAVGSIKELCPSS